LKDFPRNWFIIVLFSACMWCFNGGFINAICFTGPWHAGLTHVTGSVTLSGTRVVIPAKPGQYTYYEYLSFVLSFFAGAIFSGFIIGNTWSRWGRIQATLSIIHGLLLILAIYLSRDFEVIFSGIVISFAMGIQNSISSGYSPMTLRTSHVSGTVLDIGMTLGQMVRLRNTDNIWKLKIHIPTFISYWTGAVVGTYVFTVWAENALYVNAAAAILLGTVTFILFRTPICFFEDPQNILVVEMNSLKAQPSSQLSDIPLVTDTARYYYGTGAENSVK